MKILRQPLIKSGLLREEIKFFKRVNKEVRPIVFTLLPSQVLNIRMSLNEALKEEQEQDYMLNFYMGSCEEPDLQYPELTRQRGLGWAFLLTFEGNGFKKIAVLNAEQARNFGRSRY